MDEQEVPNLTEVGWFVVETIERMMAHGFTYEQIHTALDIDDDLMQLMLYQASLERITLERDLRGLGNLE